MYGVHKAISESFPEETDREILSGMNMFIKDKRFNNSLDGCFAYLKELVRVHRGSTRNLKMKIIDEILLR
jgi:hypothetical protein